ncbi:hypothetical protein AAZV13_19G219600 [Glycine max]
MLDRVPTLLASHSILNCSLVPNNQDLQTLYTITPVPRFFARNFDGISLGPIRIL